MSFSEPFLDELRARASLVQTIQRRVPLKKAGHEWKGCCPFHNEKTPSFYVNEDKQFYHCFGCGAHGDVIRFVCEQDGLRFPEAVRQLAAECGLEIPDTTPEQRAREDRTASLHDIMDQAARFFSDQLAGLAGAEARAYAACRGLTPETIKGFGIGFAPTGNRLSAALKVEQARLVDCGLVGVSEERRQAFERFKNRLMFPIRDTRGRVVGFGGRLLGSNGPKYLNSPDTPLFDKGRLLYNLDQAGPVARRSGRLVVVEGYMDVIALDQAGIAEAVAPNGTALTEAQMRLLWRCVAEPILCFDGDEAGERAAQRAAVNALPLLEPGHSLRFVTLPAGQDPDDIVRAGGKAAFEALLSRAEPLIDRLWRATMAGVDLKTPEQRAAARQTLRQHVGTIRDASVRQFYDAELRARFDALFSSRRDPRQAARPAQQRAVNADAEACALVLTALQSPSLVDDHIEKLAELATSDRHAAAVLQAMLEAAAGGDTDHLAPRLRADGLAVAIDHVTAGAGRLAAVATRCFEDMLANVVERRRVDADLAAATARLAAGGGDDDFEAQRSLAGQRAALAQRLRELTAVAA